MSVDAQGSDGLEDGLLRELFSYLEADGNVQGVESFARSSAVAEKGPTGLGLAPLAAQELERTRSSEKGGPRSSGSGNRSKRQRDADKVRELEAIAAAKTEQFAALLQRNRELKYKSQILSDVVILRDMQLRFIKDGGRNPAPWPLPFLQPAGGTAATGQTSSTLAQLQLLRTAAEAVKAPGSMQLLLTQEMLKSVEHADARTIGRQQMTESWKAFASEAPTLLLALDLNPGDEAAACRMKRLTADTASLCRHVSMLAPNTMLAVMQTHLETGELVAPEPGFWTGVLPCLQLTDEQLCDLRAVYELFSGIMRRILAERRAIQAQLSAGMQASDQQQQQRPMMAALQVPPEAEVLPSLERNMRKEGAAHLLVRGFVFGRTFSVVQMCRAAVHAYPYFPNPTGLVAAAAGVSV